MAWRGLHISRAAHLSLDKSRIKVRFLEVEEDGNEPLFFPIEDVAWIILDHARSTLSARMIAACMESGVAIVFSDQRHHPCGMALPFHQHFAQPEVARLQISVSQPLRKQIWAQIVKAKIANQAQALNYQQIPESDVLAKMANHVRSGDPKNVEARAARFYWSQLFENFIRSDENDLRNAMLNYGYACARAAIARAVAATGFIPSLGLHHAGHLNAFNLVDDLIEPFRPIVDRAVVEHLVERDIEENQLTLEDRQAMAAVLSRDVVVAGDQFTLLNATEMAVESLRRAMLQKNAKLLRFPEGW